MATDIIARGMITEYKSGANINFAENEDGSVTISASGSISSEDSVARDAINNHKSDTSNPHNVTPAQIGLGNVDNTSDLDKPISTAVQQAIDNKADKTVATTSADGLMSAEDKGKLDSADDTYALKSKYGDTTINIGRMVNAPIGEYSTSLGIGTVANGYASTAEGAGSQASELASHAGGYGSQAVKKCSFAHGYEVYAKHDYETAFGKHNVTNDDTLFSIGDGVEINTDGSISIARHNAFEITKTGGKLHDKDIATTDLIPTELPANGGNADTVDGLHADSFVKNTSDWTPMKFEITYGDHNYPRTSIDESIPVMPRECNYTHIVSRYKNDDSLASVLSIPADYDDDIFLYQAHTDVWSNIGNADTVGGKLPEKIFYDNGLTSDLDSATKSGCYAASPDTLNAPLSSWWLVDTVNFDNQFIVQKAHAIGNTSTTVSYIRNYANNAWSDWKNIADGGNANYAKDAGHATNADNADTVKSIREDIRYIDIFSTSLSYDHACWNKNCCITGQSVDPDGDLYIINAPELSDALWYEVMTIGNIAGSLRAYQIAHGCYGHQRKSFIRYKHDDVWSDWFEIYTSNSKPYVKGEFSCGGLVTATIKDYQIFNFTPSAVICQIANGSAFFATTIQNGFRLSLTPQHNGQILKYIAFK